MTRAYTQTPLQRLHGGPRTTGREARRADSRADRRAGIVANYGIDHRVQTFCADYAEHEARLVAELLTAEPHILVGGRRAGQATVRAELPEFNRENLMRAFGASEESIQAMARIEQPRVQLPPHPDAGKVIHRPLRSVEGVMVEDVRNADGTVSRRPRSVEAKSLDQQPQRDQNAIDCKRDEI